jgi:hypothetical protein
LRYNTVWALCGYIPVPKAIVSFDGGGIAIAICFHRKSRYYRLQHIEKMQNMDGQDREMMYGEVFGIGEMFVSVHSTQFQCIALKKSIYKIIDKKSNRNLYPLDHGRGVYRIYF